MNLKDSICKFIENKGRYYTAKIMDSKGKQVNELLVDKLNGKVQFLR